MPEAVALRLYRGDTRVWEDVFAVDLVPMDLTGYTFMAQIRLSADALPMAEMAVEILDAAAGRVRRTLTATEAEKLVPGRAVWDFELTSADGFVRTVMAGVVIIVADVSRAP